MTPRRALLLACLMCLALPASAKGKKGSAKKKDAPKKESKYISASPEAGKHIYRFDKHGRPLTGEGGAKDGAEQAEPAKSRKKKHSKKDAKEPVKKESKYISASPEAGRSVYRFDEQGRPLDGSKDKKNREVGKEDKDPESK